MKLLFDFINLFYPNLCQSCGNTLLTGESIICLQCRYEIPKTHFVSEKDNFVEHIFWGRVNLEHASAYYYFHKGSKFQDLIHNLKYKGAKEIGFELGKMYGQEMKNAPAYQNIDFVVPVPLHPKREKKRGYNQSDWIAKGISEVTGIAIDNKNLYRSVETETQTKKSRFERWQNVDNIFKIRDEKLFENKHILIVDDVVTTGSTFEACANAVLGVKGAKVSIGALAVASS